MEQRFTRVCEEEEKVGRYYTILMALNNIHLSKQQFALLVFTALNRQLSAALRKEFAKKYFTTIGTIDNVASVLLKKGLLVKEGNVLQPNPYAFPNKDEDIKLEIHLNGKAIHQTN